MNDKSTNFPPQTYSSSFYLNSIVADDDDENVIAVTHEEPRTKDVDENPILNCFIATMKYLVIISTILLCYICNVSSLVLTCLTDKHSKIRTFSSLEEYQGNKLSFRPNDVGFEGNHVQFTFKRINRLPKNAFITKQSANIMKMTLSGKGIEEIEDGAFISLYCLKELNLSGNNISDVTANIFTGLNHLEKLDLSDNKLETLSNMALTILLHLEELDLSRNKLRSIDNYAFFNQSKLRVLNLGFNHLRKLDPSLFTPLVSLEELNLESNGLSNIEVEKLNLPTLISLNLAGNSLESFDLSNNFTFGRLNHLNLSHNYLTQLNVQALKSRLHQLHSIDIDQNRWNCAVLEVITHNLKDLPISFKKNPKVHYKASVDGIECYNGYSKSYERSTEQTTTSAFSSVPKESRANESVSNFSNLDLEYFKAFREEISNQTNTIIISDSRILRNIDRIQNLVNFIIALVLVIGFLCFLRMIGVCSYFSQLLNGQDARINDGNYSEHVGLIRRNV